MNTGTVRVARVRAILIAGLATAAVALTGCTGGGSRPASAAQPAGPPASTTPVTATPSRPTASAPADASRQGGGSQLVTITPKSSTTLRPGGDFVTFDVAVDNTAGTTLRGATLVVSLGHCTCSHTPVGMIPPGRMQIWDATGNGWKPVRFDAEGTGMDYLRAVDARYGGFDLAPDDHLTVRLRVALDPVSASVPVTDGTSAIDASLVRLTQDQPTEEYTIIGGKAGTSSLPLRVQVS